MTNPRLSRRATLRLMAGLSAGALAMPLMSACATAPAPSGAGAEAAGEAATPDQAVNEVGLWSMQYPPHDTAWQMLADLYHDRHPELTVMVEPQSDWLTKYAAGLSAGTAGDLMSVHGAGAAAFMATNQLLPLTDTLGGWGAIKERFFPAVMDYYTFDGNAYGIPLHNNTPGIGFITNLDLWEGAGMTPPDVFPDWTQVWTDAKGLTQTNADGLIEVAGLSMRNYHNIQYLCGAILEQGGTYLNEETGEWLLDTDEARRALTELFYDPIYTHMVDSPDLPEVFDGLAQNRMAMGGIWIDYIPYAKVAFPEGHFGFSMRPALAGDKAIVVGEGGWGLNVNAATTKKEEALAFIEFLNDDEVMLKWLQSQHSLPCVYSLLDNPWYQSDEAKFLLPALQTVQDWVWIGPVGNKYAMDDIFLPALQELSLGNLSVDEMLLRLQADLTAKVQSFRAETGYHWP
jgi:ABC-type glycerol-3-phosphate transport system substrate-binding protein